MAGKVIVKDLVKRYGSAEAVRGVSFEVNDGEIFGLLGPNGAGKTSTVECVIGLRVPDGGSITVCGADALSQSDYVKQKIGAQLQSTSLQDKITPREALKLFGSFYEGHASPESLIERFALSEKADSAYDTLSGGQRQRLALALAFVNDPEVLFLDEPTTGLDPQSRRELHASIRRMREDGRTVLLTTHYIEEAHQLCDRIAIVDHGRVIATGKPDELIANSKTRPRVRLKSARPIDPRHVLEVPGVTAVRESGEGVEIDTVDVSRTVIGLVKLFDAAEGVVVCPACGSRSVGRGSFCSRCGAALNGERPSLPSEGTSAEIPNELIDLLVQRPTLEDVFIELTGNRLRD